MYRFTLWGQLRRRTFLWKSQSISECFILCLSTDTLLWTDIKWNTNRLIETLRERSFSSIGPTVWNSLPSDIPSLDFTPAFKQALKTHLYNSYFLFHYAPATVPFTFALSCIVHNILITCHLFAVLLLLCLFGHCKVLWATTTTLQGEKVLNKSSLLLLLV